jgi:hypothetical protein
LGKFISNGSLSWITQDNMINTINNDVNPSICLDSNKNIYLTYQTNGTIINGINSGENDIVLIKYGIPESTINEHYSIKLLKKAKKLYTSEKLQYIKNQIQNVNNIGFEPNLEYVQLNCISIIEYLKINHQY